MLFHRNVCNKGSPLLRRQWLFLSVYFLLSLSAESAQAATYYVAITGSDSNSGSESSPFKNIQKAVDVVKAGDTVIIRAGRHQSFTLKNKNGSAGAPITFRGEPGAVVDRYPKGPAGLWVISISGGSYLTIDGLELTDSNPNFPPGMCAPKPPETEGKNGIVLWGQPHHIIIKNMNIHHVRSQGILGIASDSQFINNYIHDNGRQGQATGTTQAYGVYLEGKRLVIAGNTIHNNSGNGIRTGNIASSGIENLLVDSVIENNIVYNNGGKFPHTNGNTGECRILEGGDGIVIYGGSGNIIRNNIVYGNAGNGIRVFQDTAVSSTPNAIYNNTAYKNELSGIWSTAVKSSDMTLIKNNISYLNAGRAGAAIAGVGVASNNVTTDPKFVNAAGGDFGLQEGSPAIDKGVTLAQVTGDFTGKARPEGAAYDIGAFEGAGSKANVLPGVGAGLPAGGGGGGSGAGGGGLGLGNCLK